MVSKSFSLQKKKLFLHHFIELHSTLVMNKLQLPLILRFHDFIFSTYCLNQFKIIQLDTG